MGAESLLKDELQSVEVEAPFILGLQPSALVDSVARVDWSLLDRIPGERGGSIPVAIEEVEYILKELESKSESLAIAIDSDSDSSLKTMAGGSVANTIRGLSSGFGISGGIIGACGDDEQGKLFVDNMSFNGVDLSRLRKKKGHTAQCVCLVDALGNRTMRPCLSNAVKVQAEELTKEDFNGSKWLVLRYAVLNLEVIQAAIALAKQEGLLVSLDLASFEWEKRCIALQNEAVLPSEGSRGAVFGASSDIHDQLNNGNIDRFENVYSNSLKSYPSNAVLPLHSHTNE